ncbi:NAD-dependent epimerase/dehydratase family protein [Sporolactobacillus putidus]|uniref:UDP-glucose 4-epimerase n=1 Tax=Sporolactobacillus putidus TaxID=492735 RepID=A0A917S721_9BACL|nr:NAD-dependent epimerase/dehydratase family protein [Sporolactobacillus putidus]GGL58579.1 UDP-glucose 4-epimerase [Sporolactobacillus putidus]
MKILITGGAGFIGSSILDEVLKMGWNPIVIDNLSTGKISHIPDGVPFYQLDVRSPEIKRVFKEQKPEAVIHEAAQVSVGYSEQSPFADGDANIMGTINLLQNCVENRVSKFICASSAAVYGAGDHVPLTEDCPQKPISFYGLSKHTAEQYVRLFGSTFDLNFTILRYANVYGMRQNHSKESGVISIFVNRLIRKRPLEVYGDGEQTRDFVFVRDVAKANIQAILYGDRDTFNISTNCPITLNELIARLKKTACQAAEVSHLNARNGDIRNSSLCNKKAKRLLMWGPEVGLDQGLAETIDYYRDQLVNVK